MLVYSSQLGPRLVYTLEFVGKEIFAERLLLTANRDEFINYNGPKINYSTSRVSENECWIFKVDLLSQSDIRTQVINCFDFNGNKAFFQTSTGDVNFDVFAATFYLISRYEEYLPHEKDKYGRYAHTNAVAHRESFLHLPLVNIWLQELKKILYRKFPDLKFVNRKFKFLPTYDIDIAWSYRNKGWWRNTGGLLKSVLQFNWKILLERIEVLFNKKRDPFDCYEWLHAIHRLLGIKPVYFFLLALSQEGYDKNISPAKKELQDLIKEHDLTYTTGIHPSWQSGDDDVLLEHEIKRLEKLVAHDITHSRQHYLRFTLPVTYQKLINYGISNDYSMGYGTVNGFRASVASSFYWYDLKNEKATGLLLYPFCFMDANAYYELKLTPAAAFQQLAEFYNSIKNVNGLMITLWHNNFLGTDKAFAGWREVYETFLKEIASD